MRAWTAIWRSHLLGRIQSRRNLLQEIALFLVKVHRIRLHDQPVPIIESTFRPHPLLKNPHLQTILPAVTPALRIPAFRRERLELTDGDFLDLDWLENQHLRLAVLCHGLEGSSHDPGMVRVARAFASANWDVLSWNYRGCSGEPNRLARSYHSGATSDLREVIAHVGPRPIALIGCSLGGNLVLKYLGESPPPNHVIGAAAISAPIDLAAASAMLDQNPLNRLYLKRFMIGLAAKIRIKARQFPTQVSLSGLKGLHGFAHFDERYTATLNGFTGAQDYWEQSSSRQYLPAIQTPTLLLNALDDPFLSPECFPSRDANQNPRLFLESPRHGGHLGFIPRSSPYNGWAARRAIDFLSPLIGQK